jgi:hypothetical protein
MATSGKKSFLKIGDATKMSLADARDRAREADRRRGRGTDPGEPRRLELVNGFLIDGPAYPERREARFLALLKNIGLARALEWVGRERWEEALRRVAP